MVFRNVVASFGFSLLMCACALGPTNEERLEIAQRMIDNHKYREALDYLRPLSGRGIQEYYFLTAIAGLGLNRSLEIVARLLLPVAEKGDVRAYAPMADAYRRLERYEDAVFWLQKSADTGNADSLFALARAHWEGLGVPVNRDRTFELLDMAEAREETWEDALPWREHYEFRVEMETGPEILLEDACLVYVNKPYLLDRRRDRVSAAWCDEDIDESTRAMALEEVELYLDREFGSRYGYQVKASFVTRPVGYTIDGLYNRWRGSDVVKFVYSPGATSTYSSMCRPLETDCP